MTDITLNNEEGAKLVIISPLVIRKKGTHKALFETLLKDGLTRVIVDNQMLLIEDIDELDKNTFHNIAAVIDRLILRKSEYDRIYSAFELAVKLSNGHAGIIINDKEPQYFSEEYQSTNSDIAIPELEPRLFSFNIPIGACPACNGLGVKKTISLDLILNMEKSINEDAIIPYKNFDEGNLQRQELLIACKKLGIDLDLPLNKMKKEDLNKILYGEDNINLSLTSNSGRKYSKNSFEGVINYLNRKYADTNSDWIRDWLDQYMNESVCEECGGKRLNKMALSVKVGGIDIIELTQLPIKKILSFVNSLVLNEEEIKVTDLLIKEIDARLNFLLNVGLDYLTLSRSAATLSGGEAQRIRLATQIGSKLTGVLYVLDEPSIGLHQKDNEKLIATLKSMRDLGNTVIVVEHDIETMLQSDYIVDIGLLAGVNGGRLIAYGTPEEVSKNNDSITASYLSGRKIIPYNKNRRVSKENIIIVGAKQNNLKNINVTIPLHNLVVVSGVSGSGKSTLVNEILYKGLKKHIYKSKEIPGLYDSIINQNLIDRVIEISQTPIGRTPRSNPATYTGVFDDIRELYATTELSRMRGYNKSRFSFNVKGGRCEHCFGDGVKKISMHFLPDVYVTCSACGGTRFNKETLDVKYKGKNIAEVLDMTVSEALDFFENIPKIHSKIKTIHDCGLDYIKLGQSATTLSGGEAQRVKLASELYKKPTSSTMYILDEPTTGLHSYDVEKLLQVFNEIVNTGASMIVIEHNLDVIKNADYIIDMGPDGGDAGGTVIASGTPEEVSNNKNSYTGQYLKNIL